MIDNCFLSSKTFHFSKFLRVFFQCTVQADGVNVSKEKILGGLNQRETEIGFKFQGNPYQNEKCNVP